MSQRRKQPKLKLHRHTLLPRTRSVRNARADARRTEAGYASTLLIALNACCVGIGTEIVGKRGWGPFTHLASLCKALQPGDLEEGDDGEHDCGQGVDRQPVLLHEAATLRNGLSIAYKTMQIEQNSSAYLQRSFSMTHGTHIIGKMSTVSRYDSSHHNAWSMHTIST